MLNCEGCGKRHRDEAGVAKCVARREKREAREAKKAADVARREKNLREMSVADRIQILKANGVRKESIAKTIREMYPKDADHTGRGFDWVSIIQLEHPRNWPMDEGNDVPLERSEKLALGRVMSQLGAKRITPRADAFAKSAEKFARSMWIEKKPWGPAKYGTDSIGPVWGSQLVEAMDEQFEMERLAEEDDEVNQ